MKPEIYDKIKYKYTDVNGFLTYNPASESKPNEGDWDGTNPHLWTGQANILLKLLGYCEFKEMLYTQRCNFINTMNTTEVVNGLNTRHAPAILYLNSDEYDAISLDEHDGMCFSDVSVDLYKTSDVVKYGEDHKWMFFEKEPYKTPYPKSFKEYKNLFKGLYEVIKFAIKTRDYDGSGEMDQIIFKYPELVRLTRIRAGKDRAFYRLINKQKPGLFSYMKLILSLYASSYRDKTSGHNRTFYRLVALQLRGINKFWLNRVFNYYKKQMAKKYGDKYLLEITYKRLRNKDNPIFDLINELYGE